MTNEELAEQFDDLLWGSHKCGDCIHFQLPWLCRIPRITGDKNSPINNCPDFERENMSNIKITAEVDGKQVPLKTVSTETFEAIKALEKPKEISVARLADYYDAPSRLLLKPATNINLQIGRVYSFNLGDGVKVADWGLKEDEYCIKRTYKNVRPLL